MLGVQLFVLLFALVINLSELGLCIWLFLEFVRGPCDASPVLCCRAAVSSWAPQGSSLVARSSGWPRVRLAHLESSIESQAGQSDCADFLKEKSQRKVCVLRAAQAPVP